MFNYCFEVPTFSGRNLIERDKIYKTVLFHNVHVRIKTGKQQVIETKYFVDVIDGPFYEVM